MPALSVIVPCLNEAESLAELVARLEAALGPFLPEAGDAEVLLIDDGSTDDSPARIQRLQQEFPRVRSVRHPARLGIPAAWRSGVTAARGAWICVLDGDLQYEPEQIRRLWDARDDGRADIIQGARAMVERRWDVRLLLSRGLSGLLNAAFGMSLRDNKSGFFLCRREVLEHLLAFEGRYRHWQCFVMVAAHHHGYRIHQLETPFHPRLRGRSAFGRFGLGPALGVATDLVTAAREYRGVLRS
jgi:phenylacetate-CoA ligase